MLAVVGTAHAAGAAPNGKAVASVVAGHQERILDLVDLEETCTAIECRFGEARLDRAEALARESLALEEELNDLVGPKAKKAPGGVRPLVKATTRHAALVVSAYEKWVKCTNATGHMDPCADLESIFGHARADWGPLLNRWAPYL